MNLKLTKVQKIKRHLLLQFEGICGVGSFGNSDVDFIVESTQKEIVNDNFIQSIIFDFSNLRYEFGNRFVTIFNSRIYSNDKNIYVRIIPNHNDIDNWILLMNECSNISLIEIIQENTQDSIKSINSQMGRKA
jgi:hypothetical protein